MKFIIAYSIALLLVGCQPPCPASGVETRYGTATPDRCKVSVVHEEPINLRTTAITYY